MNHERFLRVVRSTEISRMILAFVFVAIGAATAFLYSQIGLLTLSGYAQPYDTQGSLDEIMRFVANPIQYHFYSASLHATSENLVDAEIEYLVDNKPIANYLAVYVDEKYVVCVIPKSAYDKWNGEDYVFVGSFERLDPEVKTMIIDDMVKQQIALEDANQLLYDYAIDTRKSPVFIRSLLYLIMLGVFGTGIALFVLGIARYLNVLLIPEVKQLSRYGQLDFVWEEIGNEFEQAAQLDKCRIGRTGRTVYLLPGWIIVATLMRIRIIKADSLLWTYKMKQSRRILNFIDAGERHILKLNSRGRVLAFIGYESQIDLLLQAIDQKYTHVIVGFSDRIEQAWNTSMDEFQQLANEVIEESGPMDPLAGDDGGSSVIM